MESCRKSPQKAQEAVWFLSFFWDKIENQGMMVPEGFRIMRQGFVFGFSS
jgi:hypothetical protein